MNTLSTSFYEVLGVGPSADPETLRKAYRRLAHKHHPDVSNDQNAHEQMARINEAFETLIDVARRMEYDAMLAGSGLGEIPSPYRNTHQKPIIVKLRARLKGHRTPVYAVSFAPDTGQLVSSAFDNEIIWWDEEGERPDRRTKLEAGVVSTLRALPEDQLVAAGSADSVLTMYRLHGPLVESWRQGAEEWASCLAVSPDGLSVAAGSLYRTLTVNSTDDGQAIYRRQVHDQSVTAVAWSKTGQYLATGSADATVKLYHGATGALIHTFRQVRSTVTALAFSSDDRYLSVAAVDLSVRVFSMAEGTLEKMMYGHTRPIESLAFHPNSWLLASGARDGTVGLWNAAKGVGNVRIEVSTRPVSCVAFSPDGDRLAAASQDKLVRLWDVVAKEA